ncbi:LOW QUALITY PROTEIN: aspartyl/asparaginyl beta-hydroxylase-like [Pristis pectinata]|uniref:LOW QUALITY PROTEIN: aspartyl/asparaginyl beta-hydroxylase-like n=1 Tax=Pristis pectinata TaxID=685728 RepID=UPI00223DEBEF|nr:LOW QUALITY PROTEIN: aspartyl/asparaginyl beta-hydroxylase-like [Pristis pectinata]
MEGHNEMFRILNTSIESAFKYHCSERTCASTLLQAHLELCAFLAKTMTDKHGSNKNGKKGDGPSGSSFFTWFMIIALLGVWSSVAVVWFDLVDYEDVLAKAKEFRYNFSEVLQGKLGIYDADGDGDFDVEDAKILLGLKEVEGPIPAERFGKSEEPVHVAVHPPIETETGTEEPEPIEAAVAQESFKTNIEEPAEEEPEPEPAEEEPEPAEEETNEFDAGADDSDGPEAAEVEYEAESDYEEADIREESVYVEDEAVSEREEIVGDSEPEVVGVPEDSFPESEVREEEVDDYTTSDEAVLKPEEVVSEQDIPVYESETEDFSDQMDGEGEIEEDMPISDEFIEDNDPELEDKMDEFYAEEMEYDPGTDDIQEALPVQKRDEDDLSANTSQNLDVESEIQVAVPLPEAVEEPMEKEDDTLEATKEHPAEEEHVNYTEDYPEVSEPLESEPSESDHLEITGEPQEEEVIAEPEISPSKDKLKEMSSDKRSDSEVKKEEKVPAKKKKPKLLNKFDKTIKPELDAAEKLRKKGKSEEALQAFTELLRRYPQSPRAKYGKAQSEDDLAEKMRSNEILQRAITTYGEVVDLPNPTADLVKLALKRQANRQQFLGHIKRSVVTLKKLVSLYPDDISTRNELGVSYLLLGDNSNAKKVYEEVLAMAPNDGFAKVHYGFILKAANQIAESIPYLKEGLLSGDPGTDDGRFYFHLGDALQRVGDQEAYTWYELGHKRGHFASVWQRSLYNVNGLKAQPWWTAKETGYTELVKTLEKNWKLIREEGLNVMDKESGFFLPEDENLREKGDWGQFTIWQQGRRIENSCKQVPKTCALLERFPETTGCKRGQIKYSVMQPGTHVWPHTGPTNCRLRMHLGLVIPKQGCRIRCANDTREWKEGKVLIFDESFEHEVWQDAVSYRLIFIVDVWHPELTAHQRRTLSPI